MQPRLLKFIDDIRSSYWFVPTLMAAAALLLGASILFIDAEIGSDWLDGLSWYQSNKPDGAQEVLSTIAGSAITVAGVVFSITIVAVSFAASQYGPRLLTNFMSDRGNQVTLGTFIATFLYCLVVLRTIRGGDEGDFVPDLAILIALLLALCSIGVLIYFIHHVTSSIHVNSVVAGIGRQLIEMLATRYPEFLGRGPEPAFATGADLVPPPFRPGTARGSSGVVRIRSCATGYIEAMDDDRLMSLACRARLVIKLHYQPGDYIHEGRCFAEAWPREQVTDELTEEIQGIFAVSSRRTPLQDTRFLVDELVEVGTRALSPGVNDPFTAKTCLDWIGAALSEAARRKLPSPYRLDGQQTLRVIACPLQFRDYVARALGAFRQYLASDRNACLHALETIGRVADACMSSCQLEVLAAEVEALSDAAREALDPSLYRSVEACAAEVLASLREPPK